MKKELIDRLKDILEQAQMENEKNPNEKTVTPSVFENLRNKVKDVIINKNNEAEAKDEVLTKVEEIKNENPTDDAFGNVYDRIKDLIDKDDENENDFDLDKDFENFKGSYQNESYNKDEKDYFENESRYDEHYENWGETQSRREEKLRERQKQELERLQYRHKRELETLNQHKSRIEEYRKERY